MPAEYFGLHCSESYIIGVGLVLRAAGGIHTYTTKTRHAFV